MLAFERSGSDDRGSERQIQTGPTVRTPPPILVVAHDVMGGFFAVNGGGLTGEPGHVHYFGQDTLVWQDLRFGYSGLLRWALAGDLDRFYANLRWDGWQEDVRGVNADDGFSVHPPLWSRESRTGPVKRAVVPMKELWAYGMDAKRQLDAKGVGPGDPVKIVVKG